MAGWIKMALGMEVGLSPGDLVLDGDPAPPLQKGAEPPPQFSAHVYCGQTAGWIKMALGMEVCLNWSMPRCARSGTSSPPPKRGHSPQFSAHFYCRQTAGWIKMVVGVEVGLSSGDFALDGDPASLP